jgi:MraZ protein
MFFGEYAYKVDEKGRTPLPPKFRREMREGVVLIKGIEEKCVRAYPLGEWKKVADSLAKAVVGAKLRKLNRAIFGSASSVSFDTQGRIALPFSLRNYAEIGDSVIVVGVNTFVELWDEELWKKEKASSEEQASAIIESLETQL